MTTWADVEKALSPKQKKIVNFMLGKVMAQNRSIDPQEAKLLIIKKLSIATYEEEEENGSEP